MNYQELSSSWGEIINYLCSEFDITAPTYELWIRPLQILDVEGSTVKLFYPVNDLEDESKKELFRQHLTKRYLDKLVFSILAITKFSCKIELFIDKSRDAIGLTKKKEEKKETLTEDYTTIEGANLNPKYTFDTFVVGGNNKFPHAAALAVAESPAKTYNPLFLYGGSGLGKTHLMHSIAHFILQHNPKAKVLYVTSEKFTNELIDSIRASNPQSTTKFREKYRNIDVLLIDDIQFIIGKESTQEEFFHTFTFLHDNNKQIVISSDKPPKDFDTLDDRLRSRFACGLTADFSAPDYETRMAILRKKEELEGYNIDNDILKYIANNVKSNIRELEGALNKIIAYSKLNQSPLTLQMAEEALQDLITPNKQREITPEYILEVVSDHYNLSESALISSKRSKNISTARQIVMYLCRELTQCSLQAIGQALGNRDHSTIIHGCDKVQDMISDGDESVINDIRVLKKKMNIEDHTP